MSKLLIEASPHRLTAKQWSVVGAATTAAFPAGPFVMGVTAIAVTGACYVSNAMGWDGTGWVGEDGGGLKP
jgi:hypothetical protein